MIHRFREKVPNSIIRTTVMVGFPGETEEDVDELIKQRKELKFDHLGCFTYCPEEGTPGAKFKDQIPEEIKLARYKRVRQTQKRISYALNKKRIGQTYRCLVTKRNKDNLSYSCINNVYAPDDIDGERRLYSRYPLNEGDLVNAKVVNAGVYDLEAEVTDIIRKA